MNRLSAEECAKRWRFSSRFCTAAAIVLSILFIMIGLITQKYWIGLYSLLIMLILPRIKKYFLGIYILTPYYSECDPKKFYEIIRLTGYDDSRDTYKILAYTACGKHAEAVSIAKNSIRSTLYKGAKLKKVLAKAIFAFDQIFVSSIMAEDTETITTTLDFLDELVTGVDVGEGYVASSDVVKTARFMRDGDYIGLEAFLADKVKEMESHEANRYVSNKSLNKLVLRFAYAFACYKNANTERASDVFATIVTVGDGTYPAQLASDMLDAISEGREVIRTAWELAPISEKRPKLDLALNVATPIALLISIAVSLFAVGYSVYDSFFAPKEIPVHFEGIYLNMPAELVHLIYGDPEECGYEEYFDDEFYIDYGVLYEREYLGYVGTMWFGFVEVNGEYLLDEAEFYFVRSIMDQDTYDEAVEATLEYFKDTLDYADTDSVYIPGYKDAICWYIEETNVCYAYYYGVDKSGNEFSTFSFGRVNLK